MAKANKMTVAEHNALGAELQAMRDRLVTLSVEISNRYGVSKKPGLRARQASDALDALRSELDDQLARDWPDEFDPKIYHRGSKRPE